MSMANGVIRAAVPGDLPKLLALMRELAAFERYLDRFAVTEAELRRRGFPAAGEPEFFAFVIAQADGDLAGYAVFYLIPFTYDLKPTLVVKELFVRESVRSTGCGAALLDRLLTEARRRGCGWIKWAVLPENARAKEFYRRWGGKPDTQWEYWRRDVASDR